MESSISSSADYSAILQAVKAVKTAIISSRYITAKLVNREVLTLYYSIGGFISANSREGHWGKGAIKLLSELLRQEMPGLRGFSESSIKDMRIFFEEWNQIIECPQSPTSVNALLTTEAQMVINRQLTTADLTSEQLEAFLTVPFTHHREILRKTSSAEERWFYIKKCASEFLTVRKLKYALDNREYWASGLKTNNFSQIIVDDKLQKKALETFKENYVFDFIDIEDEDELVDEKVLENEIVRNVKNFIMAFGRDFAYMGNQYRVAVDNHDYFIDLLFYHRGLRCLVAVELKRGAFRAPYMGQMNLYLSALDEYVKRDDENPSIGIILCREKSDKIVEFAFRNVTSPMGVATYTLKNELPPEYREALPDPEDLRKLL